MSKIIPNGKVHPVATLFPMMSDDELGELAQDIKSNGLLSPIVLDAEGTLIDGRNRSEACLRAGVAPTYEQLNGVDPVTFIMSSNDRRRHMKLGQRAMIAAKVRSLNEQSSRSAAKLVNVALGYVGQAGVVLKYAGDQVDGVISGSIALNDAYAEAQKRKASVQSEVGKMERLRKDAPDLAALVSEDRMSLTEATGALDVRNQKKRQEEEEHQRALRDGASTFGQVILLCEPNGITPEEKAAQFLDDYFDLNTLELITGKLSAERIAQCAETLSALAKQWKKKSK